MIARFMGITPIEGKPTKPTSKPYFYYNNSQNKDYEAVPFYNTWDELMPVVEKIESLGGDENEFDIFGNCVQLGDKEFVGKTKLHAVYKAVCYYVSNLK